MLSIGICFSSLASTEPVETERNARVEQLVNRVEEIREMDFKELSRSERKELKKELKSIKKELGTEALDTPILKISLGGLIIILLLLIILL